MIPPVASEHYLTDLIEGDDHFISFQLLCHYCNPHPHAVINYQSCHIFMSFLGKRIYIHSAASLQTPTQN